ncbi:hypothetical protein [Amycolatopsis pittospori]|uniref:hypothetical protein n=1 Tax=Amycolatopsis pittospori TaxID=2749434 RepID=UPI0015F00FC6|nr:hypothetical protein [Amycolatopsis pittospori]
MTSPTEQLATALAATVEGKSGRDSNPPRQDGWHPGARLGATAEHGALLAYNDFGADGICVLQEGRGVWLNEERNGHKRDFTHRPYSVWQWMPSYNGKPTWLMGALAPEAARLELVGDDGTVVEADVVDHTFAGAIEVDMVSLRNAKERLEATEATSEEGRAEFDRLMTDSRTEMAKVKVRVYDSADTLLYDGAAISSTD